jgi:hypothetical protein
MLQDGANKRGEELTIEAVGELIEQRDDVMRAAAAVAEEIARWYGVPLGKTPTPRAS